jgi:hypothetical protein
MNHYTAAAGALTLLVGGLVFAGQELQSGPAVGKRIPGSFQPMNVTGEYAGKRHCLVCQNGDNPVAMVFARQPSSQLVKLLKVLEAETVKHSKKEMGSFVVLLSDDEGLYESLKTMAANEELKECILAMDNVAGPKGYDIAKEADVTVILYYKQTVEANHVFRKEELNDKAIELIVKDVSKIVK